MPSQDPDPMTAAVLSWLATFTDYEQKSLDAGTRSSFDLGRLERLLEELGSPHRGRSVVHVAGTKGKGSTTAFAERVLRAHGKRTFRFLSPHVETVRERLALDGEAVDGRTLSRVTDLLRASVEQRNDQASELPSFFECLTVMGFLLAREAAVDVDVLEVGLGGRLDATNVVDPTISLITPIGRDHVRILGNTLEEIAREKAGIIKPGRPVATSVPNGHAAYAVLARRAEDLGSQFFASPSAFAVSGAVASIRPDGSPQVRFHASVAGQEFRDLVIRGGAVGQAENAVLALFGARSILGRDLEEEAVRVALDQPLLPARTEWFARQRVLLDCAHTVESAQALMDVVDLISPRGTVIAVVGLTAEREAGPILGALAYRAAETFVTRLPTPRTAEPTALERSLRGFGRVLRVEDDPVRALEAARSRAGTEGICVVAGSLYLAGLLRPRLRRGEEPPCRSGQGG